MFDLTEDMAQELIAMGPDLGHRDISDALQQMVMEYTESMRAEARGLYMWHYGR